MESGYQPPSPVIIQARSDIFAPGHSEWRGQPALLYRGVQSTGGRLLPPGSPDNNTPKKGLELFYLLLPLAAVQGVIQIIKLWLREKGRVVVFTVTEGEKTKKYEFTGPVSDQTLREVLLRAVESDRPS